MSGSIAPGAQSCGSSGFLGQGNPGGISDEIVKRSIFLFAAEIERLERVVHQREHLPEFAAH